MATYKGIQGYSVQKLSSDPPAAQSVGQLWYNSNTGKFKIGTEGAGAWSSGGNLNTPRDEGAPAGTQTAALFAGGEPPNTGKTEIYDGTTWTEVADLQAVKWSPGGFGTTTAAVAAGGNPTTATTETWNGTSWTEVNNLTTPHYQMGTATSGGTSTAGLVYGGLSPAWPNQTDNTEEWDGTCWTEVADLNTTRSIQGGLGTSTAALCIGGTTTGNNDAGVTAINEQWNGTSWSEVGNILSARQAVAASGTTTAGLCFGGRPYPPSFSALTESWNGTSWTEVADLTTGRTEAGGTGTQDVAICMGGGTPGITNVTEEWNDPTYTIKTVTIS